MVTNTAPTPGVRMRVVRRLGSNTADVVGLGEAGGGGMLFEKKCSPGGRVLGEVSFLFVVTQ